MTTRADVDLRPARVEDLPSILTIERVSFTDPWARSSFATLLEQPPVYFAVALDRPTGAILGYTVASFVLDEAELANLAVDPEVRGRGVGSALLEGVLGAAESRGTRRMLLEVRASNRSAIALYESHGFAEIARRPAYYRKPVEDALVLRRFFTPAGG